MVSFHAPIVARSKEKEEQKPNTSIDKTVRQTARQSKRNPLKVNESRLGVWTYTDLTVRFDYDYRVIDSVQFGITMHHGELTMHCILNFTSHVYNFYLKF